MKERKRKRARARRTSTQLPARTPSRWDGDRLARAAGWIAVITGLALIGAAIGQPFYPDRAAHFIGRTGNLMLRVAGIALILASLLFFRARR